MTSSIKAVLASLFAVMAVVSMLQGGVIYAQMSHAVADVDSIANAQLPSLSAIRDLGTAVLRIRSSQERLILSEPDSKVIDVNAQELAYEKLDLAAAQARYEPLISSPEELKVYRSFTETLGIYLRITEPLTFLTKAGRVEEAQRLFLSPWLRVLFISADGQLRAAIKLNRDRAIDHAAASVATLSRAKRVALIASGMAACLAGVAVAISYFRVLQPLGRLTAALRALASGDMAVEIASTGRRDEIGAIGRAVEVFRTSLVRTRLAEAEQSQLRLFVQNVAASTPDGIVGFDGSGVVTFWNEAAEGLLDRKAGDMMGTGITEAMPILAHLALAPGARRAGTCETVAARRNGAGVPLELSFSRWEQDGATMFCAIFRDIRDRKQAEAVLHRLAHHDALTDLPNRLVLTSRIETAARGQRPFALLMVDLDHFKQVNDSFGHGAGDGILKITADRLLGCVGPDDTVTRVGGDEFILLLDGLADPLRATATARAVIECLGEPFRLEDRVLHLGGSIGIALAPSHGDSPEELMICADLALYAAKAQGRRGYRLFTPELRGAAMRESACRQELPRAVADGEFRLFYQPQVRLEDGCLIGAEALIRWQHPVHGLLPPDMFIPVLEKTHLAEEVGDWVIWTACRQAAAWRRAVPTFRMGVNLSGAHFRSGRLPETVVEALAAHDLPGSALELEITERIVLRHDDRMMAPLRRLMEHGVGIAFDDYGTGYASLSLLKGFPLTRLKVDRAFVRSMAESVEDAAIIRTILQLGRSLGLEVIAEGVETEAQAARLRRMGCREAQGYLFGRPMPEAEFMEKAMGGTSQTPVPLRA